MKDLEFIISTISNTLSFLQDEMQCVECEELKEDYQEAIEQLEKALRLAKGMVTP